tara:strand:+ start:438 stop:593 length:156 start_codon:yes stop_codon:yes gene_type:complete
MNDGNKKDIISDKLGANNHDMPEELKSLLEDIGDDELSDNYKELFKGVKLG